MEFTSNHTFLTVLASINRSSTGINNELPNRDLSPTFYSHQTPYSEFPSSNQSVNEESLGTASVTQTTRNDTATSFQLDTLQHIQLVLCFVVITLGLIGNLSVIVTFLKRWGKLRTYELFLISLAIADLLFSLVSPTMTAFNNLGFINLKFMGDFGCQLLNWLRVTALTVSAWTLIIISADRYMVIVWRPLIHQEPSKRIICLIIVSIWALASSLGTLYFFRVKLWNFGPRSACAIIYKDNTEDWIHSSLLFVFQMAIPILSLTVLYSIMIRTLKSTELVHLNSRAKEVRYRRNRKAIRLFVTVVCVFYILVLPYQVFYLIYTAMVQQDKSLEQNDTIRFANSILILVYSLNGCLNPLIYARLHTSFRRTLFRFISCKWKIIKRRSRPTLKKKLPDTPLIDGEELPTSMTPVLGKKSQQNGVTIVESPLLMQRYVEEANANGTRALGKKRQRNGVTVGDSPLLMKKHVEEVNGTASGTEETPF